MIVMNLEARKLNLINWISTVQEDDVLTRMEEIQREGGDWGENISTDDKRAIDEGLEQLDKGEYVNRSQVRVRVKEKYNF
jgi:hypothetical protein